MSIFQMWHWYPGQWPALVSQPTLLCNHNTDKTSTPYHPHLVSLAFCPDPHLFLLGESRENLPCGQRRPHQHIPFCNSPWASTGSWCTDCCIAFSSGFRVMSTWDSSAYVSHLGWRCQGPEEPYTSWENRPNVSIIPTPRDLETLITGSFLYLFWGWVLLCSTG